MFSSCFSHIPNCQTKRQKSQQSAIFVPDPGWIKFKNYDCQMNGDGDRAASAVRCPILAQDSGILHKLHHVVQRVGVVARQSRDLGDLYAESRQTQQGSFSAVLKPNFVRKYALESSRRDLHNALLCTTLNHMFSKSLLEFCQNLAKFFRNFENFAKT